MEEKKSDEGKHVFQHLIRVTFYDSSANSSLALTHDMESETAFYKKDSYAHYTVLPAVPCRGCPSNHPAVDDLT